METLVGNPPEDLGGRYLKFRKLGPRGGLKVARDGNLSLEPRDEYGGRVWRVDFNSDSVWSNSYKPKAESWVFPDLGPAMAKFKEVQTTLIASHWDKWSLFNRSIGGIGTVWRDGQWTEEKVYANNHGIAFWSERDEENWILAGDQTGCGQAQFKFVDHLAQILAGETVEGQKLALLITSEARLLAVPTEMVVPWQLPLGETLSWLVNREEAAPLQKGATKIGVLGAMHSHYSLYRNLTGSIAIRKLGAGQDIDSYGEGEPVDSIPQDVDRLARATIPQLERQAGL